MNPLTRRSFMARGALAAAGMSLPLSTWSNPTGANGDIRVAVVGFNSRGGGLINDFSKEQGVRVVALCDCDRTVLERGAKRFADKGQPVESYVDIRKLLENKDIDAIVIATPNHWHSLAAIWACQAGKDVYVEKPVSHNVWEGRKLVEAARKYGRIVQTGTQSRSDTGLREALEWVRAGNIGKIKIARGLCYKRRPSIGKADGTQKIPETIDYDLWCGPAPKEPLKRINLHYDWHWVWPTGNGDLGNQGIHQMDIVRWALGVERLSPKILSIGGRLGYEDDGETPNTQMVVHDYGQSMIIFEVRGLPASTNEKSMDKYSGQSVGHVIECEGGYLAGKTAFDTNGEEIKKFSGGESHAGNFIKAVRSRKANDLNADILEGHLSSALCHTGNISYRLGAKKRPAEILERIRSDAAAGETFDRLLQHLALNEVDLAKNNATLGAFLQMNPETERFIGNDEANALLTREYRAPFVVPEKV
jgi:predicted dehydrogenase